MGVGQSKENIEHDSFEMVNYDIEKGIVDDEEEKEENEEVSSVFPSSNYYGPLYLYDLPNLKTLNRNKRTKKERYIIKNHLLYALSKINN